MNRDILRLAIPNIISNITVPLLGLVDMFVVGHFESELYIGAIALATMVFNLLYWSFSFLRMGTSGFTAQAFGAKNNQESVNILLRSLLISFIAGILIVIFQNVILMIVFRFVDGSEQVRPLVEEYFYVYVWAAPFILGMYTMTGWLIGMQDAKTPMYVSISVNIINIVLSLLMVFVFKMGLKGVAFASAISQLFGFSFCLVIWNTKYKRFKVYLHWQFIKKLSDLIPFFQVNSNIFLRTLCLIVVTTFFTSTSARMGDSILAVNSLIMQLFILFSYIMDGFAYAAEALTGRYVGARDFVTLKRMIKRLFVWGLSLTLIFTLFYAVFSKNILSVLTNKTNIIELADEYLKWILLIPIAGFSAFLWDGIFIGMTASRQMRNSMFVAMLCFFVIYYAFSPSMQNDALWLAFIIYLSTRGIIQTFLFRKMK